MSKGFLALLGFSLIFAASVVSASESDALIGTYSASYYGEQADRYRIEKDGNKFRLFEHKTTINGSHWERAHENGAVNVVDKKQFEKMMKSSVAGSAFGLNFANRVVIFKVKKGFSVGRFKTETGYFVFFDGVFLDLKKEK